MNLRDRALWAYFWTSQPVRWLQRRRCRRLGTAPIMILFYHRVADAHPNPWTIDCEGFARQIDWVERRYEIISLSEAVQRLRLGVNREPAVCVTFDDGYADNAEMAIPWLVQRQIPCTYFIATDHIRTGTPFPHDVQRGVPLAPNTEAQIAEFARMGVEIGAHTRHHCDLGQAMHPEQIDDEVLGSADDVCVMTGQYPSFFAFPYGLPANMGSAAVQVARRAGFRAVCSAYGGYNVPGQDAFHLQRLHGDPDWLRFLNWMTVDPRKPHVAPRLDDETVLSEELVDAVV